MKTESEINELGKQIYTLDSLTWLGQIDKRQGYLKGYQDGQQHGMECATKQAIIDFMSWLSYENYSFSSDSTCNAATSYINHNSKTMSVADLERWDANGGLDKNYYLIPKSKVNGQQS